MERRPSSLYGKSDKSTDFLRNSSQIDSTKSDPDSTFIHGREHKLAKSKKGQETYLYQPSTQEPEVKDQYEISPEMAKFYNTIDTTKKFEIRRPKVYKGFLNKLL